MLSRIHASSGVTQKRINRSVRLLLRIDACIQNWVEEVRGRVCTKKKEEGAKERSVMFQTEMRAE